MKVSGFGIHKDTIFYAIYNGKNHGYLQYMQKPEALTTVRI